MSSWLFHLLFVNHALSQALGFGARMMKKSGPAVESVFRLAGRFGVASAIGFADDAGSHAYPV